MYNKLYVYLGGMVTGAIIACSIIIVLTVAIGYNIYLGYGCETTSIMTWEGKKCLEDIK